MSRTETLDAFREGRITLLAASDVAARGLDIPDVSHVFNFDVPWQADDYVHRIGRTGRAGKEGRSLTIVTVEDIKQLKDIEKMLGAPVTWIGDPPSAEDIESAATRKRGRGGRAGRSAGPRRDSKRPEAGRAAAANGRGRASGTRRRSEAPARPREEPMPPQVQEAAAPAPQVPAPQVPAPQAPAPQAAKRRRPEPREREPKPARQPWEPRVPRRRDREDRVPTPVGLGDHVPAFLRRPAR